jgi:chromosome partitioning protein
MSEHGGPVPNHPASRIIALINQKGGVGKTTTTVNLAAGLAASGHATLIVDLDPQAHATLSLGIDPASAPRSVYDLLLDWDDEPAAALIQARPNLFVVSSETDLAAAESELASLPDRHHRLSHALQQLTPRFKFILIDCPPSLGMLTINALAAAGEVIIPMQAHFLALQGVSKLLETVKLVRTKLNPGLAVAGVVLCMHDANATHTQEVVADLNGFFEAARAQDVPWQNARVFQPPIRRNIKLAECPSFGQTIFDYADTAPGAADYRALAQSVLAAAPGARKPAALRKKKPPAPPTADSVVSTPTSGPPPAEPNIVVKPTSPAEAAR